MTLELPVGINLALGAKLATDPDFSTFRAFGDVQKVRMEKPDVFFQSAREFF
ncbi:MAG: hypothetical protein HRU33_13120 [Rhodobacteraceae bacterium]|nr:hypothetical protein [Paracoccaceae bacterium]